MLSNEEYIDKEGKECPECKGAEIDIHDTDYPFPKCIVSMYCVSCKHEWKEQYTFEKIIAP